MAARLPLPLRRIRWARRSPLRHPAQFLWPHLWRARGSKMAKVCTSRRSALPTLDSRITGLGIVFAAGEGGCFMAYSRRCRASKPAWTQILAGFLALGQHMAHTRRASVHYLVSAPVPLLFSPVSVGGTVASTSQPRAVVGEVGTAGAVGRLAQTPLWRLNRQPCHRHVTVPL